MKNNFAPKKSMSLGSGTKNKRLWQIISIIILILALIAAGTTAYFWLDERRIANDLRDRIAELERQDIPAPAPDDDDDAAALCTTSTASFTADVGNFTLALPDSEYVIIKNHDGPGEGGDSTLISVGSCLDAANNVVDYANNNQLSISAIPSSNWPGTSFADWVAGRIDSVGVPARALPDVTIAGITAQEHAFDGLGETRKIFFENADMWYEIELYDAGFEGAPVLQKRTDVINGFSFTSP